MTNRASIDQVQSRLRVIRLAAWVPMALVAGLLLGLAVARRNGVDLGGGPPGGSDWMQWLLMSGNGFLLSWALFFQQAEVRTCTRREPGSETGVFPGAGAVIILSMVMMLNGESEELAALTILLFAPTLLVGYCLVGWGLSRLKRLSHVGAVLLGVALVNLLCQLGYSPVRFDEDARVFTFASLFLGVAFGVRLAIWWLTNEGYESARSV